MSFLSCDLQKQPQQGKEVNSLGYLGTLSFLGGLYWIERQAKESSIAELEDVSYCSMSYIPIVHDVQQNNGMFFVYVQVKSKLRAKESAMISLQKELEGKLEDEKELAAQKLENSKKENEALSNEISSVRSVVEASKKELGDEKKRSENLSKEIEVLQAALQESQKQRETLESKISDEQEKSTQSEENFKKMKAEADRKEVESDTLRLVLKEKERTLVEISSRLEVKEKALLQAEEKVKTLKDDLSSVNEKLTLNVPCKVHKLN